MNCTKRKGEGDPPAYMSSNMHSIEGNAPVKHIISRTIQVHTKEKHEKNNDVGITDDSKSCACH
jgi:hypothetical protein